VQHLMQIDLKGWGVGYVSSYQQHCLLQMLNSVAGELLFLLFLTYIFCCCKDLMSLLFAKILKHRMFPRVHTLRSSLV
jgi:hypothetical protein